MKRTRLNPPRIARYVLLLLAASAPLLLAATIGEADENVSSPDTAVAQAEEREELVARCRSLIAMFDQAARTRPDSDRLQSARQLRTTAGTECSDPASRSLVKNGIDDLHMALRIIGVDE